MGIKFLSDLHDASYSGVAYKNILLKKEILTFFATKGPSTIPELSKEFNISIPKINECINELIEDALVQDNGKSTSGIGRKPNSYGLLPNAAFFVGVQVSHDHLSIVVMNMKKDIIASQEEIPHRLENNQESLQNICREINQFIATHQIQKDKILGVGINLSGRINYRTGYSYSYFNFYEDPLSKYFEQELQLRTYLENDSKALAYGEFSSGILKDEKDALFVNVDNGIGLGILINGKIYYGKSGFSGEFGHIPIFDNDIICRCGKKGCLETEASGFALRNRVIAALQNGATSILTKKFNDLEDIRLSDIITAAKKDDNLAIELINELGEKLGRGLATLINIFNPEIIIVGGILAKSEEYLMLPLKNAVNKFSLSIVNKDTKLAYSNNGEKLAAFGACLLIRDRLLSIID
ncbi:MULTISPECIES: ROK family protein [Sphingobacterium]|jgi:predicted NBD/HSP70 family sugar kinase|uniref:ROK family protein n=2 Tax=Sphingobacterium TaxID=28453 RepID=A0ABX7CRJ6_SPHMU|nr:MULTISPECIES: ROK family protein [Sphingobacterium]MCS4163619.1 putative NBD/HSP70 family sugar kinase [Sphingobacterium sp. BIGb0116]QMV66504.1 ROK family protein [Sphingobacterium paramultivorum]QQT29272.1 ROK family protein [Sphingobacterium multivorum]QQT54702.1 ROK family protein [Sphingobacterium multivorum]QRY59924.1 ROK family protein [Sphingobacterium siyangense]